MGVPKFFRYISERYPCLSELVKDYQIPEFDNLYLDMNGIIHNCSHPNDEDPHFRITEEKIFQDIFHYIEVLFRMIKPQKLFFMAIDGVAPRAKMNQQRGRRFRSAADAAKAEQEAIKKGEKLPEEARFDSNCITPGTIFMARLHEQLKYFVVDKISNDPLWQKCKVILSGHETPGEGEHKIMDYIRYMRAQPGYNPNTRHCLYGLDADLIMLGLCTHEPHFSLLREEVKFGRKSTQKRITVPEEITFFLLHLSLLREYLELEFSDIKYKLRNFDYNLEKIIDDWVLMGFLVGNDFIPHLPNLHITEGALPILYRTYMEVMPTLDGYINEDGKLNLKRFEMFLQKLGEQDLLKFEEAKDDMLYMESKRGAKSANLTRDLEDWMADGGGDGGIVFEALEPETKPKSSRDSNLEALLRSADELCIDDDTDDCLDSDDEFSNFKKCYYQDKLEYKDVTPEVMRDQAVGYVRAIQWNLNYYYNGCCSWSWFYPHHYSPYISDIKGFTDLNFEFDMATPFHPYEQLLAVLPAASKKLLPDCYHELMTEENSLIIDYYPENFECDLNGKKQAWEAVVKIPFIDEKRLLEAMSFCNDKLTTEEKRRNSHGPMLVYTYTPKSNGSYSSPCYFPELPENHTEVHTLTYSDILVPRDKIIKGSYPGAVTDTYYPGFPTMKHLQYKGELKMAHVKVFEQPSRNESMIIKIIPNGDLTGDSVPVDLLGTSVFVGWPHLIEAKVVWITNKNRKFVSMGGPNQYNTYELKEGDIREFHMSISGTTEHYKNRMGIDFGETKVLVTVRQLIGKKFTFNSNGKLVLEKQYAENTSSFPLQSIVFNISSYDPQQRVIKDIENIFPKNSICFTLTNPYYGSQGVVQESAQVNKSVGRIKISVSVLLEPDLKSIKELYETNHTKYKPAYSVSSPLCISNVLFSKITGSMFVKVGVGNEAKRVNFGLDLKLNKKNKETPGYTKKVNGTWFYTEKVADIVREYIDKFPEVLECLSKNNDMEITLEQVFPHESEQKLVQLKKWLKSLPIDSIEKTPCNSEALDEEIISELEKVIDSFTSKAKTFIMTVKPNFLYRPEIQSGTLEPDPKTVTQILDRIVNVRQGYTVPFGAKGTVTAIRKSATNNDRDTMYEVVFDKPFRDGMRLNCSENRGYMLPKTAFINLSYGKRLVEEKQGKPDELMANSQNPSSRLNNQNNYFNNLIRPQPSFQQQQPQQSFQQQQPQQSQQWFFPQRQPPQQPQQQSFPSPNQSNSAFAHFTSKVSAPPKSLSLEDFFNNYIQPKPQTSKENTDTSNSEETSDQNENQRSPKVDKDSIQHLNNQVPQSNKENKVITTIIEDTNTISNGKQTNTEQKVESQNQQINKSSSKTSPEENIHQKKLFQEKLVNVNSLMPNFIKDNKPPKKEERAKVPQKPNRSEISGRANPRGVTVNTDFLKNVLGIRKTDENQTNNREAIKETKDQTLNDLPNKPKSEIKMTSSNISFDMLAQLANTPASVRLLTYYQSNQLGLPRYQYFPVDDNQVKALITLNDGKVIVGGPAGNREEASEKVASIVLDTLFNKIEKSETPQKPQAEPRPPKNETKAKAAVLNNSFVPLQALKSHISKSNASQNESFKQNQNSVQKDTGKSEKVPQPTDVQKPMKNRRPRIAANFLNK